MSGTVLTHRVLLSVQTFAVEELGIHRRSWAIDAPGLWIRVVRQRGMGADERLVRALGYGRASSSRSLVGVNLGGRGGVRVDDGPFQELVSGQIAILPSRAATSSRAEVEGPALFSMTIEWDSEVWGSVVRSPDFGRTSDTIRMAQHAELLCAGIERAWTHSSERPHLVRALDEVFACFRSEGLPIPWFEPRSFVPVPRSIAQLGRAIDLALSQTNSRAALVDVESAGDVCARTIQRSLPALCALWGQSVESFREHTRRNLLARACWAMTNPRATTEHIAAAVGFSTPNAFCRAMASYGLPSPGRVRNRFIELG